MKRMVFALAGFLVAGIAVVVADEVATPEQIARGRAIAERHCAQCHAVGETDESPVGEAPAFRDLGRAYPVDDLGEALAEGLVTGHDDMPEFVLEGNDVEAFLDYLGAIQR